MSLKWLLKGQLKFISQYYKVIAVSSSGYELNEIAKEKINIYSVEMSRSITPIKDLIAIYKLNKIFKTEKPFIVHTHTPKAGFIGITAAWLARVPIKLHTVAGLPLMEVSCLKKKILLLVEKFTYLLADKIYPNSFGLESYIKEMKLCGEAKLKVIGNGSSNGIDTNYFSLSEEVKNSSKAIKEKYALGENDFVFIFIGRIVKDKGINELLTAFNNLTESNKDIKLFLVGPYEEELDPISDISKSIISKNKSIFHVGFKEDVRPFLAVSNVLVFPSYREGFPNVVMQAGAMGLPSIVTNINGCNEIINNGKNGIIIEPKDENELKDAMLKLINNAELTKTLAKNSRSMIVERYEQKYVWNEILKEYKSFESQINKK